MAHPACPAADGHSDMSSSGHCGCGEATLGFSAVAALLGAFLTLLAPGLPTQGFV